LVHDNAELEKLKPLLERTIYNTTDLASLPTEVEIRSGYDETKVPAIYSYQKLIEAKEEKKLDLFALAFEGQVPSRIATSSRLTDEEKRAEIKA
jgi:hypothetical protein